MSDVPIKPKILRGAFVEFGLSFPPLVVVFQYNPLQLARNRDLAFDLPGGQAAAQSSGVGKPRTLRDFHGHDDFKDLDKLRNSQLVTVNEQTISFEVRLDATDMLDRGDTITEQFGIAPQLSTLELMALPKAEGLISGAVSALLGNANESRYPRRQNPPMILFIFGRKRVLPVNINSLHITETEFSSDLNPIRATVAMSLTVIEGKNAPYMYSNLMTETMSVLNLANIADIANVLIPG
jgi:hypothetical protein